MKSFIFKTRVLIYLVIARRKPVAIHCEPASEETSRTRYTRRDGLPRRSLSCPPRNDKVRVSPSKPTFHSFPNLSSRGRSPWRSTVNQQAKRQVERVLRDTMDCRVGHLRALLAMTKCVYRHRNPHSIPSPTCHREGEARGDPLVY